MRETWKTLRSALETPQRRYSLLLAALWPVVVLVIAVLALRKVSTTKDLADLISATASLLWPVITFTIIGWFRPELRALMARIRKGKFLGQEIELDELQASTEAAEATAETIASGAGSADAKSSATAQGATIDEHAAVDAAQDEIEEVLREASRSPRIGLILLSSKIERAARDLASFTVADISSRPIPFSTLTRELVRTEQLNPEDARALNQFYRVRSHIVHGHDSDENEVARAIDSGTRLLRLLLSRPRPPRNGPDPEPVQ